MINREEFFKKYHVAELFQKSELNWDTLEKIYEDYVANSAEYNDCCSKLEEFLNNEFKPRPDGLGGTAFHSIRGRVKLPEHLIEKIIRKRGQEHSYKYKDIDVSNYKSIVRDLVGIRILVLAKEDWESIFNKVIEIFPSDNESEIRMEENPKAYTRYGDRNIYNGKIEAAHSNKGYRSQHYVVYFQGIYCEIQVRTLAEEVYGEFDHEVKYPYREKNKFLIRYTNILSQLLDSVDELLSTCFQMNEEGWEKNDVYFKYDDYIDWMNISQEQKHDDKDIVSAIEYVNGKIDMKSSAGKIFLRKE